MKRAYRTAGGFGVRVEARLKNADLIGAREMAGLTVREVSEKTGISATTYSGYECMRLYPSKETQKRICDFYRSLGIFLFEEDVFPEELKNIRPIKYIAEKGIPKPELLSLSHVDRKLLPVIDGEVEEIVEKNELKEKIYEVLSRLPYRQQEVIRMRYIEGMTQEEIGEILHVQHSRIGQIEGQALGKLRRSKKIRKIVREFYEHGLL